MGIKFRCHACDKKLHVKTFLAGKRGVCPRCGAKVRIPRESQDTSRSAANVETDKNHPPQKDGEPDSVTAESGSGADPVQHLHRARSADRRQRPSASDPIAEAPDVVWYVRPPSGGEFGPANGEIMQRWLGEGRVSSDSMVWREGWPDWKEAGGVFPRLGATQEVVAESLPEPIPVPEPADPLALSAETTARRRIATAGKKNGRRNVTVIAVMSVVSVILLIVLAIVLQNQG